MSEHQPDLVSIIIGHAGNLTKRSLREAVNGIAAIAARASPMMVIDVGIAGYDDDPREVYDIPEARRYYLDFFDALAKAGVPASRILNGDDLLKFCRHVEAGGTVRLAENAYDEPTLRKMLTDDFLAYREQAKRKLN